MPSFDATKTKTKNAALLDGFVRELQILAFLNA
jgi:hypothetical protein